MTKWLTVLIVYNYRRQVGAERSDHSRELLGRIVGFDPRAVNGHTKFVTTQA